MGEKTKDRVRKQEGFILITNKYVVLKKVHYEENDFFCSDYGNASFFGEGCVLMRQRKKMLCGIGFGSV